MFHSTNYLEFVSRLWLVADIEGSLKDHQAILISASKVFVRSFLSRSFRDRSSIEFDSLCMANLISSMDLWFSGHAYS
jgi:hypothetical protein